MQTAGTEGRIYYHQSEDTVHIDDGSGIRRVPAMQTTAAGGLIVTRATGYAVVGVGTNDQVLTADSAVSDGVAWRAAAAGGMNWIITQAFS